MNKKILSIFTAFILATIIWGSVSLSDSYITKIEVPVKVTNLPEGYVIGSASVKEVTLNIKSKGWKVFSLIWGKKPQFLIPLHSNGLSETVQLKEAVKENEWLSNDVQIYDIYPSTFDYKVERMKEKKLKVYPDIVMNFNPEYGLSSNIVLNPESVIVYGPKSLISKLDSLPTILKEYDKLESSVNDKLELKQIENLEYNNRIFNVKFDVQKIADKSFNDLEIVVKQIPESRDVVLFPNKISIVLRGGINILSKLTNDDFHPYLDYQAIIMDTTGLLIPEIKIPDYLKLVDVKPQQLRYIIKKY
jgi:YbbR domain-containing protein